MLRAGLLAWPTSCGRLAVAANKREVPGGVDHDVEQSIIQGSPPGRA